MAFKTECTRFLDAVIALKQATIDREVQKQLDKHENYRVEMEKITQEVIERENQLTEQKIQELLEQRDLRIKSYREETAKAIELNRTNLIASVTERIGETYDDFIKNVSLLVDNSNINE